MRLKVRGIVVREKPKGESGKLLTVLTEKNGVMTVNARGVRKISAAYLKSAQLFALSDMLLYEKNGFYTLTEASLISDFYALREDVVSYALACYICEAASTFSVPDDGESEILRLTLNCLYALENKLADPRKIKAAFELRLCGEAGFAPEMSICGECGKMLDGQRFFDSDEGSVFCGDCAYAHGKTVAVSAPLAEIVEHILTCPQSRLLSFATTGEEANNLCSAAENFFVARAEKHMGTLSFLKTVLFGDL